MKVWSYTFHVRQWFLSPKNWDRQYEVGESQECWTNFLQDQEDDAEAKAYLIEYARDNDIELEIFDMKKQEIEWAHPIKKWQKKGVENG